jgi:transposase
VVAAEQARDDVSRARSDWRTAMPKLDPAKLVFLDESGFDTKMTRRTGRSDRGTPCIGAVPHGRWGANTFVAGLRVGETCAPMLMQGAMDGGWFAFWVETQLAPTLGRGDIVICDNLAVHKNARARAAIEARGAELRFLPAYSPDLNPIEMMFAKIKALVRSAAPRCFDSLAKAIGAALEAVTPDECAAYLRHAGYHST